MAERNHSAPRYLRYFPSNVGVIHGPRHWRTESGHQGPGDINIVIRFLPLEEVAILEFPSMQHIGDDMYHEDVMVLDSSGRQLTNDMSFEDVMVLDSPGRQFTNDMSFEELLVLEEQIGDVSVGLSEDAITKCLKMRTHDLCASSSSIPQSPKSDEENPICVICQAEYEDNERIGGLRCGHEYHIGCIKQWLLTKNACPICKRPAFSTEQQ